MIAPSNKAIRLVRISDSIVNILRLFVDVTNRRGLIMFAAQAIFSLFPVKNTLAAVLSDEDIVRVIHLLFRLKIRSALTPPKLIGQTKLCFFFHF